MIKWPGKVSPQVDKENLASNIDIVPTILATAGVEIPKELPGIDLLDFNAVNNRDSIFLGCFTHDMLDVNRPEAGLRARSYVGKKWKLTVWSTPDPKLDLKGWQKPTPEDKIELFDLKNDPMQKKNLANQNPEKVSKLKKEIDAWWNPS